jgi:hypothetical protein
MTFDPDFLIHAYIDQTATSSEESELSAWIQADPANARKFAEAIRLHDALRNAATLGQPLRTQRAESVPRERRRASRRWGYGLGVAGSLVIVVFGFWWLLSTSTSAAGELDRLLQSPSVAADRTYLIRSLDEAPPPAEGKQPSIDGAILYVRNPDRYVLVRHFADGRPYVTGSDGEKNWSAPPIGAVRVSGEPNRFRGPLPGHQHGIPFADLRSDLAELREAYRLQMLEPNAKGWRGLVAERRSPQHRGPRRVEIRYDATTGVIHQMIFDGMPQARGGPRGLLIELTAMEPLPADFFRHEKHHSPDRRVIEED